VSRPTPSAGPPPATPRCGKEIAHNKVMVIDHDLTITGSYNFTRSAERRNAENLLVISSRPVAAWFEENWNSRLRSARAYSGLPDPAQTVGQ
jgi:phosphatidylserine/phosphatidylglycerophosphate/cardiolipin synthase-like enzyme